ncbi:hypothetical protein V6U90_10430 [Micromonospora sp. CPCC 206060]|uniref:hypothetical protein n=1 Tax=Micromonospora sp. CPCC 206060 TaxID=3122406 RepID=UPI002FF11CAE
MTAEAHPRTPGPRRPVVAVPGPGQPADAVTEVPRLPDAPSGAARPEEAGSAPRGNVRRWVVHLPTTVTSLDAAMSLVERIRDCLGHVDVIDFGAATLSDKDRLMVRHQVFCDRPLDDLRRCGLRHEHAGVCRGNEDG